MTRSSLFMGGAGLLFVVAAQTAFAQDNAANPAAEPQKERTLCISAQYRNFKWAEYRDDGGRLLEESGALYGIATGEEKVKGWMGMRSRAALYAGQVDYDGQNQVGVPVKSDTAYLGIEGFFDGMAVMPLDDHWRIKGFAGLGAELWLRKIKDSVDVNGDDVGGYSEYWMNFLGRLGVAADVRLAENAVAYADAGMKVPFYTQNRIMLAGTVRVRPNGKASPFAEIGCSWGNVTMSVSYETSKFDKSDIVGVYQIYQPRSEQESVNFSIGWVKLL